MPAKSRIVNLWHKFDFCIETLHFVNNKSTSAIFCIFGEKEATSKMKPRTAVWLSNVRGMIQPDESTKMDNKRWVGNWKAPQEIIEWEKWIFHCDRSVLEAVPRSRVSLSRNSTLCESVTDRKMDGSQWQSTDVSSMSDETFKKRNAGMPYETREGDWLCPNER